MELRVVSYHPPLRIDSALEQRREEAFMNGRFRRKSIQISTWESKVVDITPEEITSQRINVASFYAYGRRSTIVSLLPNKEQPIWVLTKDFSIETTDSPHWVALGPGGFPAIPFIEIHNSNLFTVGEVMYPYVSRRCPTLVKRPRRADRIYDRKRKM